MTNRNHRNGCIAAIALVMLFLTPPLVAMGSGVDDDRLEAALDLAGPNRAEIARAVAEAPESHRADMVWLVSRMPEADLRSLTADRLLENLRLSVEAMETAPWREAVPREVFLDAVLPYAVVNERRDDWRADFRARFLPIVESADSPAEAAALLNQKVFPQVGVKYSTKRPKADQSGLESIDAGLASCTGLSVLLIEACRATGVPARFVGVPLWSDGSGNHSWVEIWDGERWRFTGAAEPTGMDLDKGWFAGRARGAVREDPRRAVWATTWNDSPAHFPLVWAPGDRSVRAVNVTDRYTAEPVEVPAGSGRLYVRLRDLESGRRIAAPASVVVDGSIIGRGITRDDSFDGNDHLEFVVPLDSDFMVRFELPDGELEAGQRFSRDEQMLDVETGIAVKDETGPTGKGLSRKRAEAEIDRAVKRHRAMIRRTRADEMEAKVLELDGRRMPFWYSVAGDPPSGEGRSLFISMHGGGGAPPAVNTRQWENQKRLYKPAEGVYLAPRAPTDTWNLWHQGHIDDFFDRLIENLIVFENVDPDKIYFMGYSAGGDGVYQLAPRMADRLAAAAMMAGHPNETKPDGLRNLPFTLHMGGEDRAYDRNKIARNWKVMLSDLAAGDEGGYPHEVVIHEGKGHWMEREDAVAVPWMARHRRVSRPDRIVWLQDDVTHDRFYWLASDEPKARERVVVERSGNVIDVLEGGERGLRVRLDDSMVDLDEPVIVRRGGETVFEGVVPRSRSVIDRTLKERGDPAGVFTAEVIVPPAS